MKFSEMIVPGIIAGGVLTVAYLTLQLYNQYTKFDPYTYEQLHATPLLDDEKKRCVAETYLRVWSNSTDRSALRVLPVTTQADALSEVNKQRMGIKDSNTTYILTLGDLEYILRIGNNNPLNMSLGGHNAIVRVLDELKP